MISLQTLVDPARSLGLRGTISCCSSTTSGRRAVARLCLEMPRVRTKGRSLKHDFILPGRNICQNVARTPPLAVISLTANIPIVTASTTACGPVNHLGFAGFIFISNHAALNFTVSRPE
jgi:hypothetical protein